MAKAHTHYDNLKVARNAPPEVIKTAYRILAQKYHPDLNPGDAEAARIMTVLNQSYAALADPERRKLHDQWIDEQELVQPVERPSRQTDDLKPVEPDRPMDNRYGADIPRSRSGTASRRPQANKAASIRFVLLMHFRQWWALYFVAGMIAFFYIKSREETTVAPPVIPVPPVVESVPVTSPPATPAVTQASRAAAKSSLPANPFNDLVPKAAPDPTRFAPNGKPWPKVAGYVDGYPRLRTSGRTTVTIDNSQNDATMFVKLYAIDSARHQAVRVVYVPASGRFTISGIAPGQYDVRYEDPRTMQRSKSEPFTLRQEETETGIRFSNITMTLFTVSNGNMKFTPISAAEF